MHQLQLRTPGHLQPQRHIPYRSCPDFNRLREADWGQILFLVSTSRAGLRPTPGSWLGWRHRRFERSHELGDVPDHSRIMLVRSDAFYDGTADDDSVRNLRDPGCVLQGRHAETDSHWRGGDLPELFHIVLNVADVVQLGAGNARQRDIVDESLRLSRHKFSPAGCAGRRQQENERQSGCIRRAFELIDLRGAASQGVAIQGGVRPQ